MYLIFRGRGNCIKKILLNKNLDRFDKGIGTALNVKKKSRNKIILYSLFTCISILSLNGKITFLLVRTVNLLKARFISRPVPSLGIRLISEPLDR